jgi:hypothetical protein
MLMQSRKLHRSDFGEALKRKAIDDSDRGLPRRIAIRLDTAAFL